MSPRHYCFFAAITTLFAACSTPSEAYYNQIYNSGPKFRNPANQPDPFYSIEAVFSYYDSLTDSTLHLDSRIILSYRKTNLTIDFRGYPTHRRTTSKTFYTLLKSKGWRLVQSGPNDYTIKP